MEIRIIGGCLIFVVAFIVFYLLGNAAQEWRANPRPPRFVFFWAASFAFIMEGVLAVWAAGYGLDLAFWRTISVTDPNSHWILSLGALVLSAVWMNVNVPERMCLWQRGHRPGNMTRFPVLPL